ncbi:MAG TPA: 2-phospho-L-lactate guanylyltransferase [Solirubrobacteraceae bacterium]
MRTAAILPVKRFVHAKQRLGASVADPLRRDLAGAMVADVLLALSRTGAIDLTIVVTAEETVAPAARRAGAIVVADDVEAGQSAAVELGVRRALHEGIERVLCIPGDCPALDPAELDELLAAGTGTGADPTAGSGARAEVVIVPDRHGSGTNGLLLTPPDAIAPSFGPDSCERHRAAALAAGAVCRLERPGSLLLDIDTGADLAALRERLAKASSQASNTRVILDESERAGVLSPAAGA